jgi:intracellular septation protein A
MTHRSIDTDSGQFHEASAGRILRSFVPSLVINGLFPFVLYQVLTNHGVAGVPALVAGSVFPLAYTIWSWARSRRLDLVAGISMFFIVVGVVTSLISGSVRFTLIKESFFTGLFGLAFFLSLFAPRPLMFYMARASATGGEPTRMRHWDDLWQHTGFRHAMRVMTAIWGVTFVADALIRVVLVFILSTSIFLVVSQVLFYAMFAATLFITIAYGRRAQRRGMAQRPAIGGAP